MRDDSTVALNRKARHEFTIDEIFEAGIVLTGTEIKSVRAGKANIANAYAVRSRNIALKTSNGVANARNEHVGRRSRFVRGRRPPAWTRFDLA